MEVASKRPPFELKAQSSFEDAFRKLWNGFDVCGPKAANVRGVKTRSIPAGGCTPVNNEKPPGAADNETCNESHTTTSTSSLHDETCNNPSVEREGDLSANDTTRDTDEAAPTNPSRNLEISEKESVPSNDEIGVTQQGEKAETAPVEYYNGVENNGRGWMASVVVTILALLMALGASLQLGGNIQFDFINLEGVGHQIQEVLTAKLTESTHGLLNIKELVEDSVATVVQQRPNKGGLLSSESDPDGNAEKEPFSEIVQVTDDCYENAVDTDTAKGTEPREEVETAKAKVSEGETKPVATGNTADVTRKDEIDPPSAEGTSKEGGRIVKSAPEMPESLDKGGIPSGRGHDSVTQKKEKTGEHENVGTMTSDEL